MPLAEKRVKITPRFNCMLYLWKTFAQKFAKDKNH